MLPMPVRQYLVALVWLTLALPRLSLRVCLAGPVGAPEPLHHDGEGRREYDPARAGGDQRASQIIEESAVHECSHFASHTCAW
jgi:hypothetical protein